jgi:hypothetical protein
MAHVADFTARGHLIGCMELGDTTCDCASQLYAIAVSAEMRTRPTLTDLQREIIDDAGKLWTKICRAVPDGPSRTGDLDELIKPVHLIQRYFMAEAAAVAYPADYRPLGVGMRFVHQADWNPGMDAMICQVSEYRGHAGRCDGGN